MFTLMMRKIFRSLPVIFILLAWTIMTAHQIIPHDHYLCDSTGEGEHHGPGPYENTDHNKGFPLHCHAFNDLTSEKMVKFVLANYIHFTLFYSGGFLYAFQPVSNSVTITVSDRDISEFPLLNFCSLRAPPSLS
jgi:hypothetical protein